MRKKCIIFILLLTGMLAIGVGVSNAQSTMSNTPLDVNGEVWLNSTDMEKKAFLLGAGSAVVLEFHIREKKAEEPSRFIKGWIEVLKGMTWSELSMRIDRYYHANPNKLERDLFDVIWHEIIAPNMKK